MNMAQIIVFIVLPAGAYFLGSIPFAFFIGIAHGVDIRTVGSKNVGATNLGRVLGMRYFWQALFLDGAKGFVPVLATALLIRVWDRHFEVLPNWAPLITGGACLLGHLFPIWLKGLRGGKGVATGFGLVLGFWPLYTLAGIAGGLFFLFMLLVYRYVSLAAMTASMVFVGTVAYLASWHYNPLVDTWLTWPQRWPLIMVAGVFSLLIIVRHRANIVRLMKGTEPKVGMGRKNLPKREGGAATE